MLAPRHWSSLFPPLHIANCTRCSHRGVVTTETGASSAESIIVLVLAVTYRAAGSASDTSACQPSCQLSVTLHNQKAHTATDGMSCFAPSNLGRTSRVPTPVITGQQAVRKGCAARPLCRSAAALKQTFLCSVTAIDPKLRLQRHYWPASHHCGAAQAFEAHTRALALKVHLT